MDFLLYLPTNSPPLHFLLGFIRWTLYGGFNLHLHIDVSIYGKPNTPYLCGTLLHSGAHGDELGMSYSLWFGVLLEITTLEYMYEWCVKGEPVYLIWILRPDSECW